MARGRRDHATVPTFAKAPRALTGRPDAAAICHPALRGRDRAPTAIGELAHSIRGPLGTIKPAGAGRRAPLHRLYQLCLAERSAATRSGLRRSRAAPGRHAATFRARTRVEHKPKLDSLWVNLLKAGGITVDTPPAQHPVRHLLCRSAERAGPIRFEDPRLPLMMAAPPRGDTFVAVAPHPGLLLMWESWLRHEVLAGTGRGERLSISFNFA